MKRQLPQWMLGVPSNHQNNTGDSSRSSCDKDIEDGRAVKEPKQIKKRKQSSHNELDNDFDRERVEKERKGSKNKRDRSSKIEEKAIESENKETVAPTGSVKGKPPRNPLVKCKERKGTKENVSSCGEVIKNKMNSRKAKGPDRIEFCRDVASTVRLDDEDDIDLTVEDLMIIANEYIQEDNNSKQVETSMEEHKSVNRSQGIADSLTSHGVHSVASKFVESTTERNHCSNSNVVDLTKTGSSFESENPTQSMLDLFLGPWLKKTPEEEKKFESKTSDLDFEFEAYKRKSVLVEVKPVTSTTTTTTLGKKKSSLKDKVMMFLD